MRRVLVLALAGWLANPAAAQLVTVVAASSKKATAAGPILFPRSAPGGGLYKALPSSSGGTFPSDGPALNNLGQVAFTAELEGGGSGLYLSAANAGAVSRVALEGQAAPPGLGDYSGFLIGGDGLALNDTGRLAAVVQVTGGFGTAAVRFDGLSNLSAPPTVIAVDGGAAPGGSPDYQGFSNNPVRLNSNGQVAFASTLGDGSGDQQGLFRGAGDAPAPTQTLLVRNTVNSPAPGNPVFNTIGNYSKLSDAGAIAFQADLGPNAEGGGLFRATGTAVTALAVLGEAAPAGLGGTYTGFQLANSVPAMNPAGQIAFAANTDGDRKGVLRFEPGSGTVSVLVADGATAPGAGAGTLDGFEGPRINAGGRAVFRGSVSGGTNNGGVFTVATEGGPVTAVVRNGDPAGTLAGVTFGSASNSGALPTSGLRINDAGGVSFWADLTGTGVTNNNDSSIWYRAPNGDLLLLVREGDLLTVADGDERRLVGLPDEYQLSDAGIAFTAAFVDGTQAIVFVSLVPVPEPAAVLGLAAAGLLALTRLRRVC